MESALFSQSTDAWNGFYFGMTRNNAIERADEILSPYKILDESRIPLNIYSKTAVLFNIYSDGHLLSLGNDKYKKMHFENYKTNNPNCKIIEISSKQDHYKQSYFEDSNIKLYFDDDKLIGIMVQFSADNDYIMSGLYEKLGKESVHHEIIAQTYSSGKYSYSYHDIYFWDNEYKLSVFFKFANKEMSDYWIIDNYYILQELQDINDMQRLQAEKEEAQRKQEEEKKTEGTVF